MTDTFEDRLWDALKDEAGRPGSELPTDRFVAPPARRGTIARRTGMGLAAAAAVGVVLAVVPGGGSTPAYAVEVQKDGAVKVTAHEARNLISDKAQVEALESKLRAAGINVVQDATGPYTCHFNSGSRKEFTQIPTPPGGNATTVWGQAHGPALHPTFILHRGDTAWIQSGRSDEGDRLYAVGFLPATCAPATGH